MKKLLIPTLIIFGIISFVNCGTKGQNGVPKGSEVEEKGQNGVPKGSEVEEITKGPHGLYLIFDKDSSGKNLPKKKYFFFGNKTDSTKTDYARLNVAMFSSDESKKSKTNLHQILVYLNENYNLDYYGKNLGDKGKRQETRFNLLISPEQSCCYFDVKYPSDKDQVLTLEIQGGMWLANKKYKKINYKTSKKDTKPSDFPATSLWKEIIEDIKGAQSLTYLDIHLESK